MANSSAEKALSGVAQTSSPTDPRASFDVEKQDHLDTNLVHSPKEFDPMATAKPCSPFYLYKHDSPRSSTEQFKANSPAIHVAVHDLEAGTPNLTPHTTRQERSKNTGNGVVRLWPRTKQCMTKPKQRSCQWLANLPRWQRLLIKIIFAIIIVGAIVGLAVGISIKVHGGVNSGMNSQAPIPT